MLARYMYVFIVLCFKSSFARNATYLHRGTAGGYHISCKMLHSSVGLSGRLRGWKAQCSYPRNAQQCCPTRRGPAKCSAEYQLLQLGRDDCWYWGGMIAGTGEACGLREKNKRNLLRDSASADVFCTPGRRRAVSVRSKNAVLKANKRSRCDGLGSRVAPLLTAATTAMLSHKQQMCLPTQCGPQRTTAITIGTSFLGAIGRDAQEAGHCNWNQRFPYAALQPQAPEASDTMCSGESTGGMMLVPFQNLRSVCHQARSARTVLLRCTQ